QRNPGWCSRLFPDSVSLHPGYAGYVLFLRSAMNIENLLARGYFSKELPRPFNTKQFAKLIAQTTTFPGDFGNTISKGHKIGSSKLGKYSLARAGLFRRNLSICNP